MRLYDYKVSNENNETLFSFAYENDMNKIWDFAKILLKCSNAKKLNIEISLNEKGGIE